MTTWRAGPDGDPLPEPAGYSGRPPADLDAKQHDELTAFLRAHGDHWVVTGPCLDGDWYATPRRDRGGSRLLAPTLAALHGKVCQRNQRFRVADP